MKIKLPRKRKKAYKKAHINDKTAYMAARIVNEVSRDEGWDGPYWKFVKKYGTGKNRFKVISYW